jgi:signal transduction histidine kinase
MKSAGSLALIMSAIHNMRERWGEETRLDKHKLSLNLKMLFAFGSAIAILLFVTVISYRSIAISSENDRWVLHTHEVLEHLQKLLYAMTNVESSSRGYILTGNDIYLNAYPVNVQSTERHLAAIRFLTSDNLEQQRQLPALEAVIAQKIEATQRVSAVRRTEGLVAAVAAIEIGRGPRLMAELEEIIGRMRSEEERLLLLRNAEAKRSVSHTKIILIFGTVLGVFTAGAAGWSVLRDDSRRRLAETTLRAVNQELEEFAYAASHDLKAPLRVIDNASQWLEEDLQEHLTGESRESMKLLRSRVMRMEKLLDDLLEYSRIGRTTDQRHVEIISGDALLDNILTLLSPREGFAVSASPRFSQIQVYRMPLQQILMNLVGNAIKHHDKSTGRIEITVEDRGVDHAFAVSDDGPGIPAQFHDQVFRMFQTLRPRDQVEGSGMGLAMVRKNIELVGGTIKLESADGRGSMFSFTLPKPLQAKRGYA